uniref:Large ribosomal subunit protein uL18c n=1 Tax=Harveyella mirabilis TaxID=282355 RepID=A0A3S8UVX6_9FLOR|nr:ribosomal protein L18 [Harveyella mirabilis]
MNKKNHKKIRLYIFKSNKHIYANIIDDKKKYILTSISTISKENKNTIKSFKNCTNAQIIGTNIGIQLTKLNIKNIIFDKGKNIYHGQIKILADAIRQQGIIF